MSCTDSFPEHLLTLLKVSKYVHLATCSKKDCFPSVSLMNYTYIPPHKAYVHTDESEKARRESHYIIFATSKKTGKYENIKENPQVSLLIHDWVTAKKLSLRKNSASNTPTPGPAGENEHPSRLLNLLQELNQAELSQMSATLRGHAKIIDPSGQESQYYKEELLKANPDAEVFILGDDTVVVKVKIESAKVSDSENNTSVYE